MSESGDYQPAAHWSGHDFTSARRAYVDHAARSYDAAKVKKITRADCLPDSITCNSEAPVFFVVDITGSMSDWPATIFSKLPYLEHEGKEYLGEGFEAVFSAVGDALNPQGEDYPVQVRQPAKGAEMKKELDALIIEGKGGGSSEESYDLPALYFSRNCKTPNAIRKPIFIFIGDEGVYNYVDKEAAATWAKTKLEKNLTPAEVFAELTAKYAVYIIRKPYNCSGEEVNKPGTRDHAIQAQWASFLGEDHVVSLPDPNRVVDVIFGIFAKETGRVDYFEKELTDRQMKDKDGKVKIAAVLKSLHSIHAKDVSHKKIEGPVGVAKSVTKRTGRGGAKSISLLDD